MMRLPLAPASCSLDQAGLRRQLARYRAAGDGAQLVQRTARTLVVCVAPNAPERALSDLIAVERECCPFLGLDWDPATRRLTVSVSEAHDEPALAAIAHAIGLGGAAAWAGAGA